MARTHTFLKSGVTACKQKRETLSICQGLFTLNLEFAIPITFKLFATLGDLLPANAVRNVSTINIDKNASLNSIIDQYRIPRELAHLVLINGVFVCDENRDEPGALKEGDVLAVWPPVAGG